jgi:hypothetical protein
MKKIFLFFALLSFFLSSAQVVFLGGSNAAGIGSDAPPIGWTSIDELYFNDFDVTPTPSALSSGQKGLRINAPLAVVNSGTTVLDMGTISQIDDSTVDTGTWTLTNVKAGGEYVVKVNLSSEPSITGATKIPNTPAFQANTPMLMYVYVFNNQIGYAFLEWF